MKNTKGTLIDVINYTTKVQVVNHYLDYDEIWGEWLKKEMYSECKKIFDEKTLSQKTKNILNFNAELNDTNSKCWENVNNNSYIRGRNIFTYFRRIFFNQLTTKTIKINKEEANLSEVFPTQTNENVLEVDIIEYGLNKKKIDLLIESFEVEMYYEQLKLQLPYFSERDIMIVLQSTSDFSLAGQFNISERMIRQTRLRIKNKLNYFWKLGFVQNELTQNEKTIIDLYARANNTRLNNEFNVEDIAKAKVKIDEICKRKLELLLEKGLDNQISDLQIKFKLSIWDGIFFKKRLDIKELKKKIPSFNLEKVEDDDGSDILIISCDWNHREDFINITLGELNLPFKEFNLRSNLIDFLLFDAVTLENNIDSLLPDKINSFLKEMEATEIKENDLLIELERKGIVFPIRERYRNGGAILRYILSEPKIEELGE